MLPVTISVAPTSDVSVTASVNGGATANQYDYELITANLLFPSGMVSTQNVVVRIYNDEWIESTENLSLTLSIAGTNALLHPDKKNHSITITDNDADIIMDAATTIFTENFQSYAAGAVVAPWSRLTVGAVNTNNWVFGENGAMTGTRSAYITQNTGTRPLTYSVTAPDTTLLVSPSINTTGYTNLELSFNYKCNGEAGYDFGALMYGTSPTGPFTAVSGEIYQGVSALTNRVVKLPAACNNRANLYLAWYWVNDNSAGANPPFAVDDIVLTGKLPKTIETALTSKSIYLAPNTTNYVISSNNKIISTIINSTSHDFGCTSVAIDRVGTGATEYAVSGASNYLTQKSILVTPANPSASATLNLTLYYTAAEKTGWESATGKLWNTNAKLARTGGAVSNVIASNPTANGNTNSLHTIIRSSYRSGDFAVQASISNGFGNGNSAGGFAVGDPVIPLPIEILNLKAHLQRNQTALVQWTAVSDQQITQFEMERSTDGLTFETVGTLAANANQTIYEWTDLQIPASSRWYYRIRAVDADGEFKISNQVELQVSLTLSLSVFPNPATNELFFSWNAIPDETSQIQILDVQGKTLFQTNCKQSLTQFQVESLPAGLYFYQAVFLGKTFSGKWLKQ